VLREYSFDRSDLLVAGGAPRLPAVPEVQRLAAGVELVEQPRLLLRGQPLVHLAHQDRVLALDPQGQRVAVLAVEDREPAIRPGGHLEHAQEPAGRTRPAIFATRRSSTSR
jgi:hypothetical protein